MKAFNPLLLFALLVTQSASAETADLSGAWSVDASACGDVFTKENNKIVFKKDADLHAGGLIVEKKHIIGTMQKCTVKSFREDGPDVKIVASCSDGVAYSDVTFDVKITGENKITLSSKQPVPVEMQYSRCAM